jgi:MYXO-CTERM domain-containing protein
MAAAALMGMLAWLASSTARGDIAPDDGLADRQAEALADVAQNLTPLRAYDAGDRSDCVVMQSDGFGLVAQLELDRRGLSGGADPATAAPWAKHIADSIASLVGTGGTQGRCHWSNAGAPGVMNATVAVAYALHRYGDSWPADVKESVRVAVQDATWEVSFYLHNANINIVVAELLAGEALALTTLFDQGKAHLEAVADRTMRHGGIELHAPLYTAHHVPPLVFAQVLADEPMRSLCRTLLEYTLLVEAHLYLPGGGQSAPQSRDYSGGAADPDRAMLPVIWLLTGDPALSFDPSQAYNFVVAAATDYVLPEAVRSVFLDKEDGYTFWAYTDAQQGASRTPDSVYDLGFEGERAIPWQSVVLPNGDGALGVAYGYRRAALYVASGTYVRDPAGGFAILYQYQPAVTTDTDHIGDSLGGSGMNDDPDDFICELYDYERMVYGQTAIALWDPTLQDKPSGVVRTHQDTRVHLPNMAARGGEQVKSGDWTVGRLGDVLVAYHPLGTVAVEESRDSGQWTYLRLGGRSGGIVELATMADFATADAYAADLASRQLSFTADPLAAEFEARDPATGELVTIRLEHKPERRVVAGTEQTLTDALDHGLMESPWVTWTATEQRLRLERGCYPRIEYDWDDATVTESSAPADCGETPDGGGGGSGGGTVDGGTAGGGGGVTGAAPNPEEDDGCGCSTPGQRRLPWAVGAVLVALLGLRLRRRSKQVAPRSR